MWRVTCHVIIIIIIMIIIIRRRRRRRRRIGYYLVYPCLDVGTTFGNQYR